MARTSIESSDEMKRRKIVVSIFIFNFVITQNLPRDIRKFSVENICQLAYVKILLFKHASELDI